MRPTSPFEHRHGEIRWQGRSRHIPKVVDFRDMLFGRNGRLNKPLLSLRVERDLGPCRHALAQRVVAGSMEVHYVFDEKPRTPPSAVPSTGAPAGAPAPHQKAEPGRS